MTKHLLTQVGQVLLLAGARNARQLRVLVHLLLHLLGGGGVALHGAELGTDQEQHGLLAALPVALGLRRVGASQAVVTTVNHRSAGVATQNGEMGHIMAFQRVENKIQNQLVSRASRLSGGLDLLGENVKQLGY